MMQHDTRAGVQAHRATRASQRRIGSTPPRIGRIPRPVSGLQRSSTVSGPPQEPRNKKSARIATFLRLRIVAWRQNADRSPKTQQKRPFSGLEEQRGVRNRKKVAKIPSFLFLQWAQSPQRGRFREKRAGYHGQQPKTRKKKGARYADASRKINLAGIYASLAPYCS